MNVNNEWNRIYEKGCGVVSRLMPLCRMRNTGAYGIGGFGW